MTNSFFKFGVYRVLEKSSSYIYLYNSDIYLNTLSCFMYYSGVPTPKLEWFKDATPLSTLNNPRYKLTSSSMVLQVRRIQLDDAGIFQCFAANTAGEIQAFTNLVVTSKMNSNRNISPKYTKLPSSTHPHVVSNLYDWEALSSTKTFWIYFGASYHMFHYMDTEFFLKTWVNDDRIFISGWTIASS